MFSKTTDNCFVKPENLKSGSASVAKHYQPVHINKTRIVQNSGGSNLFGDHVADHYMVGPNEMYHSNSNESLKRMGQ